MPLPNTVLKTRVVGQYFNGVGAPAKGMAIFQPVMSSVGEGVAVVPVQVRTKVSADGNVIADLITGEQGGPTVGIIYEYSLLLDGGGYIKRHYQIPVTDDPVEIESLVPLTPSPEAGRFVLPARAARPANPQRGEIYYNEVTGDAEYWDDVDDEWIGLSLTTGTPPVGAAGGSLAGTYPNPTLAANSVDTAQLKDLSVTAGKLSIVYVPKNTYDNDLLLTGTALSDLQDQIDNMTNVLVLAEGDPVPPGTPSGTVIVRYAP